MLVSPSGCGKSLGETGFFHKYSKFQVYQVQILKIKFSQWGHLPREQILKISGISYIVELAIIQL